jgi:hypothetical protein
VNGQRILYAPVNERMAMEKRGKAAVRGATYNASTHRTPSPSNGVASMPLNVLDVLASIRAEHIEEINYTDCLDNSVEGTHTSNSVFVALKPGVAFEIGVGSYVVEQQAALAANHPRLIGVYDEATGLPIPGAEIADSASGSFVSTTETGTAALAFMTDGEHVVRVRKSGYANLRVPVAISASDTTPVTVTLARRKSQD